ncbi:MAG: hypothetical protein ABSG25_09860 [Bryobacteraceae bacterium]
MAGNVPERTLRKRSIAETGGQRSEAPLAGCEKELRQVSGLSHFDRKLSIPHCRTGVFAYHSRGEAASFRLLEQAAEKGYFTLE